MEKIKCIVKRPDSKPYVTWISNRLENLQNFVGGYIETVTLFDDVVLICNEDGRRLGLPYNCRVCGVDFVGNIIFCGINEDEFGNIPYDIDTFKYMFQDLWKKEV